MRTRQTRFGKVDGETRPAAWRDSVKTSVTWLLGASNGRPTAVRVDVPSDGQCIGGLVIVPPFGRERVVTFRTLRILALNAARRGFVVVSPDLAGDGDTPHIDGQSLPAEWHQDVDVAYTLAGELTSASPVNIVGVRLGAALASSFSTSGGERRVLWEPVDGRTCLRQQRMLRRLAFAPPEVQGARELPGRLLTHNDWVSLERLQIPASPITDVELVSDPDLVIALSKSATNAAPVLQSRIDRVIAHLGRSSPREMVELNCRLSASVAPGITEEFLQMESGVGGVLTYATSQDTRAGILFTAMGSELREGPGGIWTSLARDLAGHGFMSLRADRAGIGEAVDPGMPTQPRPYTDVAVTATVAGIRSLRLRAPDVKIAAAGICAGAWCLLRAGAHEPVDHIIAVNPMAWHPRESHYSDAFYRRMLGEGQEDDPPGSSSRLRTSRKKAITAISRGFERLGREDVYAHAAIVLRRDAIGERPVRLIRPLPTTTTVDLIVGPREKRDFLAKGGAKLLRLHPGRAPVRLSTYVDLDHNVQCESSRRIVAVHLWNVTSVLATGSS